MPISIHDYLQVDQAQWLQPDDCIDATLLQDGLSEARVLNWPSMCKKAASKPACRSIKRTQPLYTCSYKSLSTFYQVQQASCSCGPNAAAMPLIPYHCVDELRVVCSRFIQASVKGDATH
jgi:hypothetical protein